MKPKNGAHSTWKKGRHPGSPQLGFLEPEQFIKYLKALNCCFTSDTEQQPKVSQGQSCRSSPPTYTHVLGGGASVRGHPEAPAHPASGPAAVCRWGIRCALLSPPERVSPLGLVQLPKPQSFTVGPGLWAGSPFITAKGGWLQNKCDFSRALIKKENCPWRKECRHHLFI